jgi:hypothetical protein
MLRALSLSLMLALGCVAPAHAEEWRRYPGAVTALTPDLPGELVLRPARCAHLFAPDQDGVLAWVVEIAPELADGTHAFRLLDARMSAVDGIHDGPANFDIAFFNGLGRCESDPPNEPIRFRGPGDEHGTVPLNATHAFITVTNKPHSAVDLQIRLD